MNHLWRSFLLHRTFISSSVSLRNKASSVWLLLLWLGGSSHCSCVSLVPGSSALKHHTSYKLWRNHSSLLFLFLLILPFTHLCPRLVEYHQLVHLSYAQTTVCLPLVVRTNKAPSSLVSQHTVVRFGHTTLSNIHNTTLCGKAMKVGLL